MLVPWQAPTQPLIHIVGPPRNLQALTLSRRPRRLPRNNLSQPSTQWIWPITRLKRLNFSNRTDLKVVQVTSIITQLTSFLNKSWRQFGGSIKTVNYKRKEQRRKPGSSCTSGAKLAPVLKERSRDGRSTRITQLISKKREGLSGLTGNPRILILTVTLPFLTPALMNRSWLRGSALNVKTMSMTLMTITHHHRNDCQTWI